MTTTPTPDAGAAVYGPALRLRAEMRHLEGTHRLARYRQETPDLLEAADEIVAALDEVDPPEPLPCVCQPPCESLGDATL